jgi:hypothetical protein
MKGSVRWCPPNAAIALCAIAVVTGALAPAAHAIEPSHCALRAASGLVTPNADEPGPPLPSGILSDAESDELAFVRLSRSLESHVSGVLLAEITDVAQRMSAFDALAPQPIPDHGFSLVDQAIRLQV